MPDELNFDLFGSDAEAADAGGGPDEPPRVWTVSEVNHAVRGLLEGAFPPIWVSGEIANWTRARSGHCYFTLKDESAQLRCVMWRNDARALPIDPEEGMRVRVHGSLTLYEARGDYQLAVRKLEGEGREGLWRLAFEKLRRQLEEEGLLAPERKRPIPRYPSCVGVVTSPTGAAVRDILSVLRRRAPWCRVLLRGARVQGEGAADEVAAALDHLAASGAVDVIIVGRGGGSIEDLWAFNEEPVARAIARCPVPVISAVGHEVDVTISDLIADLRAPTPSAAAEAVVADGRALLEELARVPARLAQGLRNAVERRARLLRELEGRLRSAMERAQAPARQAVDVAVGRMERAVRRVVERRREALGTLSGTLQALSPLATLARGYAVARAPDGRVLRRVEELPAGAPFALRVSDGEVACESHGPTEG